MHEEEAAGGVCAESKEVCNDCSIDKDLGNPHRVLQLQ